MRGSRSKQRKKTQVHNYFCENTDRKSKRRRCGSRHSQTRFIFNALRTSNFPWLSVRLQKKLCYKAVIVYTCARFEERVYRGSFGNSICNAFHPEKRFNYPYMPRPMDCRFLSRHEKIKTSLSRFSFQRVFLLAVRTVRQMHYFTKPHWVC